MTYSNAALLGIIEGLTEFIPVSSTSHLIIFETLLNQNTPHHPTFTISIQIGAILAAILLYKNTFKKIIRLDKTQRPLTKNIFISIMPIFTLGFLLYPYIKLLFSPHVVAYGLILGSFVMIIVEKSSYFQTKTTSTTSLINQKQALLIGLCQCAALIPGFSRSGSSIVGGLIAKLDYQTAANYSFIIAIPVIISAVFYDLFKQVNILSKEDFTLILIGITTSFIVGYLAMNTFIKTIQKVKLLPFAIYRILLGIIILLIF